MATTDFHRRLKIVSRHFGHPIASMARDALLAALEEREAKMEAEKAAKKKPRVTREAPNSLGVLDGVPISKSIDSSSELDRFVDFIAAAPTEDDQQQRIRQVYTMLEQTTTSENELKAIIAKLDARIASLLPPLI